MQTQTSPTDIIKALLFPETPNPVRSKTIVEYARTYKEALNVPEWERPEWVNAMHKALTYAGKDALIGHLPIIRLNVYDYLLAEAKNESL